MPGWYWRRARVAGERPTGTGRDRRGRVRERDTVERMDFPYRIAGRRAPDKAEVMVERRPHEVATDLARALGVKQNQIALRWSIDGWPDGLDGCCRGSPGRCLVLMSYPCIRRAVRRRAAQNTCGSIKVPCLFVSGTRDAFGTPEELEAATALIPGPVTHVWIEGGDHGLRRRDADAASAVAAWLRGPTTKR